MGIHVGVQPAGLVGHRPYAGGRTDADRAGISRAVALRRFGAVGGVFDGGARGVAGDDQVERRIVKAAIVAEFGVCHRVCICSAVGGVWSRAAQVTQIAIAVGITPVGDISGLGVIPEINGVDQRHTVRSV